jgi:hypothetical protein
MPIRLMFALVVSCLVPSAAECAAPFVGGRRAADLESSNGIDHLMGNRECSVCVRRQFMKPLALPIMEVGPKPLWVPPYEANGYCGRDLDGVWRSYPTGLEALTILDRPKVPSVALSSRRLNLHIDTAGVGRWSTALVEVWLTRDGWTWHLYQNAPHADSLLVALPGEGRFGLRVVVHDVNGHASPTPRTGEAPQLWVEVDERSSSLGACCNGFDGDGHCIQGNHFAAFLHYSGEFDQPGDVKLVKQAGLRHPCGYIKRVESEEPEKVVPPPPPPGWLGGRNR